MIKNRERHQKHMGIIFCPKYDQDWNILIFIELEEYKTISTKELEN